MRPRVAFSSASDDLYNTLIERKIVWSIVDFFHQVQSSTNEKMQAILLALRTDNKQ